MKRFFLLSLLSLFCVTNIMAQSRMEIGANFSPMGKEVITTNTSRLLYTVGVYGEYRWSLGRHFDAGARLDVQGGTVSSGSSIANPWAISTDLLAVADFNLFPGKTVNPYLGIGVGPGFGMHNNTTLDNLWAGSFLAMADARLGLELFQHLRVAVDVKTPVFGNPRFTYLCINVGWVF